MNNLRPTILLVALLALAVASTGCPQRKGKRTEKPPIIVVVIDTLRADHVGAYGYQRPTTRNIDDFGAGAVRFDRAQATATWTVPSMVSLFTGVYPWRHDIQTSELTGKRSVKEQPTLSEGFVTLAEALGEAGYLTMGVTANGHIAPQFGMAQGFEHYKVFDFVNRGPVDKQLARWVKHLRRAYRRGKPYFLYVHYFDPHHPYMPVHPYVDRWRPDVKLADVEAIIKTDFMKLIGKDHFLKNPSDMKLLVDLYDSEIAAVDASIKRLLNTLPGIDNAVVVITSDHGEAFGEQRAMLHGGDLFDETLRVPLFIRFPDGKQAGRVVPQTVSLIDLYPTLGNIAGAALPPYLEGVDLMPYLDGEPPETRDVFALVKRDPTRHWHGVINDMYKWVRRVTTSGKTKRELLFDRVNDPKEKKNLAKEKPDDVQKMRTTWDERPHPEVLFEPGTTGEEIDPATREQLRNLGYL